ncbi:MAG: VOC family protein [Anaerolineales bacterium]
MKKLKSICLITPDVQGLCDFYAHMLEVTPEGDRTFATISTPEISLSISSTQLTENMAPGLEINSRGGNCFLEFEVDDVDMEYERLRTLNVEVVKLPTTQPWGLRSVWFRDPQGNLINFYARVAHAGS